MTGRPYTAEELQTLAHAIDRTIASAEKAGKDYLSQSRAAAAVVMAAHRDMTYGEALDLVTMYRNRRQH